MSRQEKEQKLEEEKKKRDAKFANGVTMRDLQRCDFKIKLKNSRQDMYFVLISHKKVSFLPSWSCLDTDCN